MWCFSAGQEQSDSSMSQSNLWENRWGLASFPGAQRQVNTPPSFKAEGKEGPVEISQSHKNADEEARKGLTQSLYKYLQVHRVV